MRGYTPVAKGVEMANFEFLQHKENVYNYFREI